MAEQLVSRRRALTLVAASLATGLLPSHSPATQFEWNGTALGADARILLNGVDPAEAESTFEACRQEIERLEQVYSLYRAASELSALNRNGFTSQASPELRAVLALSRRLHAATGGLFDPTVQPLWQAYATGFARYGTAFRLTASEHTRLIALIDLQRVATDGHAIELPPGGALTFNGIAQGYITDRVAALLHRRGYDGVLIDIGEVRALGHQPDRRPFDIAIRESGLHVPLASAALATSAPSALVLSPEQGIGHILDPRTGQTPADWRCVTVQHASAAVADALSTALVLAPRSEARRITARVAGCRVWATAPDGTTEEMHG